MDDLDIEINVLSQVKPHHNTVVFFGHCNEPDHVCLVTEYLAGGSVADLIYSGITLRYHVFSMKFRE